MLLKKIHSPIYLLLLTLVLVLQSCKKEPQKIHPQQKTKNQYTKYITLAEKHFYDQKYDSAFYYYTKIKNSSDTAKDQNRIIYALMQCSSIQFLQNDYSSCETSATEAILLFQKTTDLTHKLSIYNILGMNYSALFDYDNSIYYYTKALKSTEDPTLKLPLLNNIAAAYLNKNEYSEALKILVPLSKNIETQKNKENYSNILDNIGNIYFKLKDPRSLFYLNLALKMSKQMKSESGITNVYIHLSKYYKTNNPRLSNDYAKLAYKKAAEINSVDNRLESLALLIQTSTENRSKNYSEKYILLNDSITKARQKAKNQFAKIKYDSKKEKDENLILKTQKAETALELEKHKNRNLLLYFLTLIGALSSVFLYYFLKALNKKEKIQTSYDTETKIAKKLHDELANDVYHTMAFAETQDLSSSQNKEILLHNLDTIYSRTRNISKENSTIDTGLHFLADLKGMISSFNTDAVNILINGMDAVNWNALEANKKITVYRVLQELLVNMKKHSQCSLAIITFKKIENKLQIECNDNGIGAAFDKLNSKNGLQNIENRILAIKGTITFDTKPSKGFKTSLMIPI